MSTILAFLSGRQITNGNGTPQNGAQLYFYRAGTTTDLTVWQNSAGTTPHPQPVPCDSGGFVPLVYVDDTFSWKVVVKTSAGVTLQTYDNLPAATTEAAATGFAPPLIAWTQVNAAASPVSLSANDAGKGYECDTSAGSITFNLPSAASIGNGKGFFFKKTNASNTLTIDPFGSQTIDDVSTALAITAKDTCLGIFSNGAEWYTVAGYGLLNIMNNLAEDTTPDSNSDFLLEYDTSAALAKKVKPNRFLFSGTSQATTSGTAFDFTSLPAGIKRIHVLFTGVSLSGTDSLLVQIGDSGGISSSGYVSSGAITGTGTSATTSTSGFYIDVGTATRVVTGIMTIYRSTGNTWVAAHCVGVGDGSAHGGSSKALSNELDRIRITRTGSNTFDAGAVNIYYE